MSISFHCDCGKAFRVPDNYAGRRTKCPTCQAALTVPTPAAADGADDFEVLDDEPEPASAPQPPARTAAARPQAPAPEPPKKKKKKRKKQEDREETAEERLERVRAAEAKAARIFRGIAFIVLGAAILVGVVIMFTVYGTAMKDLGAKANIGAILLGVIGVAAIGKGLIGMFFGQFFGEE